MHRFDSSFTLLRKTIVLQGRNISAIPAFDPTGNASDGPYVDIRPIHPLITCQRNCGLAQRGLGEVWSSVAAVAKNAKPHLCCTTYLDCALPLDLCIVFQSGWL